MHGAAPNSCETYLNSLTNREIDNVFKSYRNKISFVGHTHKLIIISYNEEKTIFHRFEDHPFKMDKDSRYIINVGSVGQPRD